MTETLFKIIVMVVAVAIIYKIIFGDKKGLPVFEMHFKNGRMTSHKGKIPERFEKECRSIMKQDKLTGSISAEKLNGVHVHVSANLPENIAQRIRNQFPFERYQKKSIDQTKHSA